MTEGDYPDIYKRMAEAGRRFADNIIAEAIREATRNAETIPPEPMEKLWPYEYSGTLEQWRAWCTERGDLETLAEVEMMAGMVPR